MHLAKQINNSLDVSRKSSKRTEYLKNQFLILIQSNINITPNNHREVLLRINKFIEHISKCTKINDIRRVSKKHLISFVSVYLNAKSTKAPEDRLKQVKIELKMIISIYKGASVNVDFSDLDISIKNYSFWSKIF